jgi:hypothetical protein
MAISRNAANNKTELPRGNSSHAKPVLSPIKIATMPMKTPRCQMFAATTGTSGRTSSVWLNRAKIQSITPSAAGMQKP